MMRFGSGILGVALASALCGPITWAQTETVPAKTSSTESVETFYLTNISEQGDAGEIVAAIRNILPFTAKIYFVFSQHALIVHTTPDQLVVARQLLSDLDRPKKTYRLTYTITEMEDGKTIGTQHFSFDEVSGQKTSLKQGSKVPVITGTYNPGNSGRESQFTYLDIGLNVDAALDESVNGVRLRTKAEQSSVAEQKTIADVQEPIVRQTVLEGTSILLPGKPQVLGSLDVPGTTRHEDVAVVMEVVR
jgi:type II secretory pathway component GspD/PulD (secretin)